jgi:hypothetical protein
MDLVLFSGPARYNEKVHVCLELTCKVGQHDKSAKQKSKTV